MCQLTFRQKKLHFSVFLSFQSISKLHLNRGYNRLTRCAIEKGIIFRFLKRVLTPWV